MCSCWTGPTVPLRWYNGDLQRQMQGGGFGTRHKKSFLVLLGSFSMKPQQTWRDGSIPLRDGRKQKALATYALVEMPCAWTQCCQARQSWRLLYLIRLRSELTRKNARKLAAKRTNWYVEV